MGQRLRAMRQMGLAGYRIGLTIAPIIPVPDWPAEYDQLLADCAEALDGVPDPDLTVEMITHRFTAGSKPVLEGWYPGSALEMEKAQRARKTTKFGSVKYVFPRERMTELRATLEASVGRHLPHARLLYWTYWCELKVRWQKRWTLARMSSAGLVQTKGFGFWFVLAM